jgi:hypothetical protein
MMFVFCAISVTIEAIKCFEEQQNGLYDMLLSVAAMWFSENQRGDPPDVGRIGNPTYDRPLTVFSVY